MSIPSCAKEDMAYLRRIHLVRFQASLLLMMKPRSQRETTMKRYVGIDVAQKECAYLNTTNFRGDYLYRYVALLLR